VKCYFVYILAGRRNGTLYIGVTNNLMRRTNEHKNGEISGFTKKSGVNRLVYYETFGSIGSAITREKRLKKWLSLSSETTPPGQTCMMTWSHEWIPAFAGMTRLGWSFQVGGASEACGFECLL